jgi:TonB family protein
MTPVPDFLELVLQQVVHPLPSEKSIAGAELSLQQHDFGKTEMDCIMQAQKVQNLLYPPLGFSPTYCLDHAQDSLRISYDFSSLMTARNQLGVFQGRKVVLDQATNLGSVVAITAHLDTLQEVPLTAGDLTPSADLEKADHKPVAISSGVATGLKISGEPPIYPDSAKRDHVSGSVVLAARIGRDGRIHSLGIISTPRTDLAIASIAAVRQWTFKSFLLNGTPVDVETQLTVNFNFGPASTHLY